MRKLVDHWNVANVTTHSETEYWMFEDTDKNMLTCVSCCTHRNGKKIYLMSDDNNPNKFYGTEKEIKEIIKRFLGEKSSIKLEQN